MQPQAFGSERRPPALADHRTPFVANEWYVAALSEEVSREMMARTLLGRSILLYRTLGGSVAALRNRCPHRSYPLAQSKLDGDDVVCGYHGLRFAPDGRCIQVPSQAEPPPGLGARAYPVVEQAPLVWIWMGDPELADPATIPDHHWLSAAGYAGYSGYIHCNSNYIRLHENVLDLTHFPYVHGEAKGGDDYIRATPQITTEGDSVSITRRLLDRPVNAAFGNLIGNAGHRVNRTSESWFMTPAFHIAHARIEDLEGGVGGKTEFNIKIVHCFTPETAHTSHYFFSSARDMRIEDEALTAANYERTRATFLEDDAALERIEDIWINEDGSDYREMSVFGDRAGLQMRRIIARRAAREQVARKPETVEAANADTAG